MAVMPVSPIASAPSSRGQPSDGSAADANGFGSLLGGLDADRQDSGETGGSAAAAARASHGAKTKAASTGDRKTEANGAAENSRESAATTTEAQPAKAADPAKGAK